MVDGRIASFEQLTVWQESQSLAVTIYKITKTFPKDEMFALTNQIRRAASSISANIAEGFGRETPKDKLHFYTMSYGSLLEIKNFMYLSQKLEYITETELDVVLSQIVSCQKLVNASKKSLKS